MLLVVSARS